MRNLSIVARTGWVIGGVLIWASTVAQTEIPAESKSGEVTMVTEDTSFDAVIDRQQKNLDTIDERIKGWLFLTITLDKHLNNLRKTSVEDVKSKVDNVTKYIDAINFDTESDFSIAAETIRERSSKIFELLSVNNTLRALLVISRLNGAGGFPR